MQTCSVIYSGIPIEYQLTIKKIKNLNIRLSRKGEIFVSAPYGMSKEKINGFVAQKGDWIIRRLAEIEKLNKSEDRRIYDGKTVYILGRPYTLHISPCPPPRRDMVTIEKNVVTIRTHTPKDEDALRALYLERLKKKARPVFYEVLSKVYPLVEPLGVKRPEIQIRNMETIWGSCHVGRQKITLNLQLLKAPQSCIEQVILHELIHFLHPNHSAAFYSQLSALMPDWKKQKELLESRFQDGI